MHRRFCVSLRESIYDVVTNKSRHLGFAGNTTKLRKSTQFYKNWCSNGVVNQPTCRTELLPVGVNSTRRAICCTAVFAFAWVYTFSVMATLECHMRYCSDLMSMPRFAMLVQKVWQKVWGEMRGRGVSGCSRLYFLTADVKDRLKFRLARIVPSLDTCRKSQ